MERPLRVGVVGAGLIAQSEHIPNLIHLAGQFEVAGVCDPSPAARAFVAERFGVAVFPDSDALHGEAIDAVVVAAPDFAHVDETLKALAAGRHVFCEKPLCYGPAEADRIIAARERSGKIVQVGYMKRFDPAFEACLDLVADGGEALRYVSVEVNDPDAWPFLEAHPHRLADDLPQALIEAGRAAQRVQIAAALGPDVPPDIMRGFATSYCSAMIHDINAVHGLLDRVGLGAADAMIGQVVGAEIFAAGEGSLGTVRLAGGRAALNLVHVAVPKLAFYRERISLYFDDRIVELTFPAPYLNHHPTELVVRQPRGDRLETRHIDTGHGEAFLRELEGFRSAIVDGDPVRNTVEAAQRDQALACAFAGHVARRRSAHEQELRAARRPDVE